MDLSYKVSITLGNIATDWSDRIGYEIPKIKPNPYKSNDDPYGLEEERKNMMDELKPCIDANTGISPKAYCNIPVEKWRENRVIKRAKPNTLHNSPIFAVRKKNSDGKHPEKERRVVIDSRLIDITLDPEKLERFPLPWIRYLHRKMPKHSLYTVIDLLQCFHAFKIFRSSRSYLTFTDMEGLTCGPSLTARTD
ncbi:hypothetical protein INT46_011688 [Mucor plumbeus]|uniref:Reverse transcriptase domain-containing protein n=1 Tax=Mucor plumbeus TaxID=97098 RepID=A0A8H7QI15_9FUNG|nr:hypothetical protein INT46_011688 [Mucor plumbeus]